MRVSCKVTISLLALACFSLPTRVLAYELAVTENGNNSSSQVVVSSDANQTVTQSNAASVSNAVTAESSTGSNAVTGSAGNSTVQTGDAQSTTEIENTANTNTATIDPCCQDAGNSVTVTGNGEGSENVVATSQNSTQSITTTNNATIVNTITARASTGGNRIIDSDGDARITTGTATVQTTIVNIGNKNQSTQSGTSASILTILNSNNGANSHNEISVNGNVDSSVITSNSAQIFNTVQAFADTGNNTIENANGRISLSTGNASTMVTISNEVNTTSTYLSCGCEEDPDDPGEPGQGGVPTPNGGIASSSPSQSSGGSGGNSDNGIGGVLGATTGEVLPATGMNMSLWATIFNVFMLLFGLYLRRTAGRSPAKA